MTEYPLARILEFVRKVAPFDALDTKALQDLVSSMEIAYFPKGEVIIRGGGEASSFCHIIQSGSAKVTLAGGEGEEILIDVRGEGETFGALSLLRGGAALFSVTAREDLITYAIEERAFKALVESQPAVERYFNASLARNLQAVRRSAEHQMPEVTGLAGANLNTAMMRSKVSDLMNKKVLTCHPATPIRTAAARMSERQVGSIVVAGEDGRPQGIVTDTDLRVRCLAQGRGPDRPVVEIISRPVLITHPETYAFESLLEMSRHGVHHLVVCENDRMVGIVCDHDLQVLTGGSPVGLVSDIGKVATIDELVDLHFRIDRVLEMLLKLSGSAQNLLALVTEFNDRVTRRLLDIVREEMEEEGLGRPPVSFCWLALGSEGRREQTLRTDQDNAIVFSNVGSELFPRIQKWFLSYAERVVEGLERCGFPKCAGGVMASNPRWCQTEAGWQETFLGWVNNPTPRTLRMASIFFDYREIYSEADLTAPLTAKVAEAVEGNRLFLRFMARNGLYNRPPLGFLRQFVVEKDGEHKNMLNLKLSGLTPIVDGARVLALDQHVAETNTFDRLEEVTRRGLIQESSSEDLREAFSFITLLRISRHLEDRAAGNQPSNHIDPATLNNLQRKMLKESFQVISRMQDHLAQRYQTRLVN